MKSRPFRAALLGALAGALCLAGCGNDAKNQHTQATEQRNPEMTKPAGYDGLNGTVRDIPESKPFMPGPDYRPPAPAQGMQTASAQPRLVETGSGGMAPLAGAWVTEPAEPPSATTGGSGEGGATEPKGKATAPAKKKK